MYSKDFVEGRLEISGQNSLQYDFTRYCLQEELET